jgi:SAM-dependent methyltransferase
MTPINSSTLFETTACLLCGSQAADLVYETRDRLMGLDGKFALVACRNCGLIYLNPRPTRASIGRYYPPGYEPFVEAVPHRLPWWQRWPLQYGLQKRCQPIVTRKPGGRALDVGCATGLFLAELRRRGGWEVAGVEPSPEAAAYARKTFGLAVHEGDLASARFPAAHFDAITMWDVLEHLHDPLADLREVRRVIKPDGLFLFRVPVWDSLDARWFGPYWAGLDSPRHMVVLARRTVRPLLAEAGFRPLRMWTLSGSHASFALSLRLWLEERLPQRRLRAAILSGFYHPLTRLLAAPYFWITDRLGLGSQLTVLAEPLGVEL